jgi:hypothetical protein
VSRFDQLRNEPGARELLSFGGEAEDKFEPNRLVRDGRVRRSAGGWAEGSAYTLLFLP